MGGTSKSTQNSNLQTEVFPNVFGNTGYDQSGKYANLAYKYATNGTPDSWMQRSINTEDQLNKLTSQKSPYYDSIVSILNQQSAPSQYMGKLENTINQGTAYDQTLQNAILHPSYSPTSAAQQGILNSLMDVTAARGSVRGLGAPTQTALAQAVAPELVQAQNNYIQQLQGAQGLALQKQGMGISGYENLLGSDLAKRAATLGGYQGLLSSDQARQQQAMQGLESIIQSSLQRVGLGQQENQNATQALLELAGLSMPQIVSGTQLTGTSKGWKIL